MASEADHTHTCKTLALKVAPAARLLSLARLPTLHVRPEQKCHCGPTVCTAGRQSALPPPEPSPSIMLPTPQAAAYPPSPSLHLLTLRGREGSFPHVASTLCSGSFGKVAKGLKQSERAADVSAGPRLRAAAGAPAVADSPGLPHWASSPRRRHPWGSLGQPTSFQKCVLFLPEVLEGLGSTTQ